MRLDNMGKSDREKYLDLLAEKYPEREDICREIINLSAIMNLPKGTEHFMSDLHGEYGAFLHILNNCSGVIKEKVDLLFGKTRSTQERRELCTLVYYPVEKLALMREQNGDRPLPDSWYRSTIVDLVALAKFLSSKYTRSKVRKAMPKDFAYILDELIHEQKDEDDGTSSSRPWPVSSSAWLSTICTSSAISTTGAARPTRSSTSSWTTTASTSSGATTTCSGWAPPAATGPAAPTSSA